MAACVAWHAGQRLDASGPGRLPQAACGGVAEAPAAAAAARHKHQSRPQRQTTPRVSAPAGNDSGSPRSVSGVVTVPHSGLLALLTSPDASTGLLPQCPPQLQHNSSAAAPAAAGKSAGVPPPSSSATRSDVGSPATPSSWDSSHSHASATEVAAPPAAAAAAGCSSGKQQHQQMGLQLWSLQPLALLPVDTAMACCGGNTAGATVQQSQVWTLQQRWALAQRRQQWLLQQQGQATGLPPQQLTPAPACPSQNETAGGALAPPPAATVGAGRKRSRSSRKVSRADMARIAQMLDPPAVGASAWPPPMDTVTAAKRLRKMSDRDILLLAARAVTSKPAPDGAVSSPLQQQLPPLQLPAPTGRGMQMPAAEQPRPAMVPPAASPAAAVVVLLGPAPAVPAQQRHSGASAAAPASPAAGAGPSLRLPDRLPAADAPARAVPSLPTAAAAAAAWGSSLSPGLLDADDGMLDGDWALADLLDDVLDG